MPVRVLRDDPSAEPIGSVVLVHAFTRSPEALDSLAAECVARGARVLRPHLGSLWWPTSTNNAAYLATVTDALYAELAPGPLVVAGHSAGAAAGAWIAGLLARKGVDVRTVILIDGVESPTRLIRRAWPSLAGTSVRAVCAPPSRCNRNGALSAWLAEQTGDVESVLVPGAGHGDIEGPTRAAYRWACGDDPSQPAAGEVRDLVRRWVREGLSGP